MCVWGRGGGDRGEKRGGGAKGKTSQLFPVQIINSLPYNYLSGANKGCCPDPRVQIPVSFLGSDAGSSEQSSLDHPWLCQAGQAVLYKVT